MKAAVGLLFALVIVSVAMLLSWRQPEAPSVGEFLQQHWAYPMAPQGGPPEGFSSLEASLAPESCGQCHAEQHRQWSESLHSAAMGPGILWQLQLMDAKHSRDCLKCHAPLTEQFVLLAQERGWAKSMAPPPDHVPPDLHRKGLACAACHVREHQRFGPKAKSNMPDSVPHGGFSEHKAFGDSRFCATCHQFAEDGPRLNGKLREDTYNQWRETRYAKEGKHCQSCHMPERRHLWKGIHDQEMTRSALTVRLSAEQLDAGRVHARAEVINSGAGHHFPTYVVPEIRLHLEHIDDAGQVVELDSHILAWRANLALTEEVFDQRLAAGQGIVLDGESLAEGGRVRVRIGVAPRRQYLRSYEDYLQRKGERLAPGTASLLRQAIEEARSAEYEFVAAEQPIPAIAN